MATMTKADIATRVLRRIGVLALGQTASSEDSTLVEERVDSAHDELRKAGLAPFALATVPTWAQPGLIDYVAADVAPEFGVPLARVFGSPVSAQQAQMMAERRLSKQIAGYKHPIPVRTDYF